MHVVFLSPLGNLGGAEICLLDMIAAVHQWNDHARVSVVLAETGPLAERAKSLGANVVIVPLSRQLSILGDSNSRNTLERLLRAFFATPAVMIYARRLRAQLRRLHPTIIHSNGLKMHALGALARPRDTSLVWHMHDYLNSRPLMRRILSAVAPRANAIVAVSQSIADDAGRLLRPSGVVTIPNAVDLDEFSPIGPAIALDKFCGLPVAPAETVRVGLLATMAWWKGHRLFLEAIAKLNPTLPFRGYIIGGALYRTGSKQESIEELKSYAERLGISDRVGFTGLVTEPASAIRALDVVVHASTEPEPFGRVIVEAMACGKAVISAGIGGAAEILSKGDFSRRFDGSSAHLAQVIATLVSDSGERARLGADGLDAARRHYSRQRLSVDLSLLYDRLVPHATSAMAAVAL